MAAHWTYAQFVTDSDLEQGDFLHPTPELQGIFATVHPHFTHDKYVGFLVATQSCDLVRRGDSPKAPYVTLVTVRSLPLVAPKLLIEALNPIASAVFKKEDRQRAEDFLSKLFNQNQQAYGLFYLHPDVDSGVGEASVAFLRVSVALRSEHYEKLVQARRGRLAPEFQAKFGWLLGNLFARPATRDWEVSELRDVVKRCMDDVELLKKLRWLDEEVVAEARKKGFDLSKASDEDLERCRPAPPVDRAIAAVLKNIDKVAADALTNEQKKKLANRLKNDGTFTKLL